MLAYPQTHTAEVINKLNLFCFCFFFIILSCKLNGWEWLWVTNQISAKQQKKKRNKIIELDKIQKSKSWASDVYNCCPST